MAKGTDNHSDLELALLLWRNASETMYIQRIMLKYRFFLFPFKLAAWKVAYNIHSYSSKSNLFQYFTIELVKKILKFSYCIITYRWCKWDIPQETRRKFSSGNYWFKLYICKDAFKRWQYDLYFDMIKSICYLKEFYVSLR